MRELVKITVVSALLLHLCLVSQAVMVMYEITNTGGDLWEYKYTIDNDETFDIKSLSIIFDSNLCSNLGLSSSPAISGNWDEQFFNHLPGSRMYDALAVGGNRIAVGEIVSGFGVSFRYSGIGIPASQYFEIYNPDDYSVLLASGWTAPIPEPATIILMTMGLAMLGKTKH